MTEKIEFKVGDKVTWESQAQGSTKTKTGIVVAVLSSKKYGYGLRKSVFIMANRKFPKHTLMFSGDGIPGNSEIGYLVEVITGKKANPKLYMPYPSKLRKVEK